MNNYTVESGRVILRNGEPFVSIHRCEGGATPVEADDLTHIIAALLNEHEEVDATDE